MRVIVLALAASAALAACGTEKHEADLANGKRLYTGQLENPKQKPTANYQACGNCHALARADSSTTTGPNLDAAFAQARKDGFTTSTIRGVVHGQTLHPRRSSIM